MNAEDLEKLVDLHCELEKWKMCREHFDSLPANTGNLIKSIEIRFNDGIHIREITSLKAMNPTHRQAIIDKIADAVTDTYEEIKKKHESAQITF